MPKQTVNADIFLCALEQIAEELELPCQRNENEIKVRFSEWTGILLCIQVRDGQKPEFYFWVRTDSWHYDDERTDIHDTISILLSIWCKNAASFSSALYDEMHPAMPSLSDFEVYARYIVPSQLPQGLLRLSGLEEFRKLIADTFVFTYLFWEVFGGCPCRTCKKTLGIKYDFKNTLGKRLQTKVERVFGSPKKKNLKDRQLPTWKYYRNFDKGISIVASGPLTEFLRGFGKGKNEVIESINGKLILEESRRHYLSRRLEEEAKRIFQVFEPRQMRSIDYYANENRIIAIGKAHILIFDADSGLLNFKAERDLLKNRHENEYRLLFKPSSINWAGKIDDSDFEDLAAQLLLREPNVLRVRKVSHTHEADGKKDLIIDLKVLPQNYQKLPENINPYDVLKVIVQCKAYQKGVNKTAVTDIRDTIQGYDYDGFLLIVSSYLTRDLTEHLDRLRLKNQFWIDWWTRQEIEEKLKIHEDLLHSFPKVFTVAS